MPTQKVLEEFLLDGSLITQDGLDNAKQYAAENSLTFEHSLVVLGLVSQELLQRVIASISGIPFVDLKKEKISHDILSLIPEPIARSHSIVAFSLRGKILSVASTSIDDFQVVDFISKKTGFTVRQHLTDKESIRTILIQYQRSLKAEFGDLISKDSEAIKQINDATTELSGDDLKNASEDLPVIRIVDTLLKHAINQSASDIHIEPMESELIVRYRIDGILHDAMILPKYASETITARIKVLARLKLDEKRLPQDGRFKMDLEGEKISFRVSILPTFYGEKTVMRLLRENSGGFNLEGLGFHGEGLERIHRAMRQTTGIILTTGPTGSGKSTTLYTLLSLLNTPEVNISTIEDPVEYQLPRINQTQVRPEIGFSFADGLRTLLRQDPDIMMVGEIRDTETAKLAVNAALTGHLVLSTLHTNSASGTLPRLSEMGVEPFLLISTLKIVIGQRLVRKLAGNKIAYFLSDAEIADLSKYIDLETILTHLKTEKIVGQDATWKTIQLYKATKEDGYKGRLGIYEVLTVTDTIKNSILAGGTPDTIESIAIQEGMLTMLEDGIFKAVQGYTTIEEVLRVVSE